MKHTLYLLLSFENTGIQLITCSILVAINRCSSRNRSLLFDCTKKQPLLDAFEYRSSLGVGGFLRHLEKHLHALFYPFLTKWMSDIRTHQARTLLEPLLPTVCWMKTMNFAIRKQTRKQTRKQNVMWIGGTVQKQHIDRKLGKTHERK